MTDGHARERDVADAVDARRGGRDAGTPRGGVGAAAWALVLAMARAVLRAGRRVREWNRRGGAGASGLAQLVEVHALQAAGDATVTVALAGSLFFSVPTGQARTRVALYLLVTMAPFAVLAPVLGPLLDRFRRGRRIALAVTMATRAVLAIVIARSLGKGGAPLALYPAALGVLVASKAYGTARSAAVPRLLPSGMPLVRANSRLVLAGVVAPGVAGAIAVGVTRAFGHGTALRLGAAVYCAAALLALRLPRRADGGRAAAATGRVDAGPAQPRGLRGRLAPLGPQVAAALRSSAALRGLGGFLLLYGAFVVREHPVGGLPSNVTLGSLAVGLGVGNIVGLWLGARTADVAPRRLHVGLLGVTVLATLLATLRFGLFTAFAVALVASATSAAAKLALDATIQGRIDESVRTATFARSETTLQLAWVVGGGLGIALPTVPWIGFGIASAILAVAALSAATPSHRRRGSVPAVDSTAGERQPLRG